MIKWQIRKKNLFNTHKNGRIKGGKDIIHRK